MLTISQLWTACADVAVDLDDAGLDWHKLSPVATSLLPIANELTLLHADRAQSGTTHEVRMALGALQMMENSLHWLEQHEYDALETELHRELEHALSAAAQTLEYLEQKTAQGGTTLLPRAT